MKETKTYDNLLLHGPVVEAEIFADEETFLKMKNFGTPETFSIAKLLIDTGANISGLDRSIIKFLSLRNYQNTEEWVHGEGGSWQVKRYGCVLYLPIFKKKALSIDVLEGNYSSASYDGIIGRDVLRFCDFHYNGLKNSFTLNAKGF